LSTLDSRHRGREHAEQIGQKIARRTSRSSRFEYRDTPTLQRQREYWRPFAHVEVRRQASTVEY
jgi:hypothetical protein